MEGKDQSVIWAIYISIILVFFFGLFRWIYQRQNKDKKSMIMIGIIVIIMVHMIGTLSLYPIDIGIVWLKEKNIEKDYLKKIVFLERKRFKLCYYIFYGLHIIELFIILPFVYYFYEEWNEESTIKTRIFGALRRSLFFLLLFIALFFSGTFMSITEKKNSKLYLKHFQQTFKPEYIKMSTFFIVDVVLLFGIILFCIYTAFGFSLFPLQIIKTNSINVPASVTDIKHALILNREKQRAIEVRYTGFYTQMNLKDRRALESLQREERTLVRCIRLAEEGKRKWEQPISTILHLLQLLLGFFFLVISIGITLLMSMTIISKLENTYFKILYNYISKKWPFYCMSTLSQYLFKTFPINLIMITLFILYFYVTTIVAIFNTKMTKKFTFFKYNIHKKIKNNTLHHDFLISLAILMLMVFSFNYTLSEIIIPKYYTHQNNQSHYNYAIFNSQKIYNYRNLLKSIFLSFKAQDHPSDRLYTLTVLNTIINDITSNYEFFKTWYSYSYLLFLAVFLLSFIILSFCSRTENIQNNTEIEPEREVFFLSI
ncbi:hypothetical protein PNEG_00436 [Pneumocystis murina B123]|uniref:Lysosomal cobalamin transporter n=1 Tax=Pneumocystis murina (strain B123) TaxID=1069680 RepID=M7NRP0_PNEMU|nr:hypothetical protein PNEG_00436 [Pneumocystis murina B123]EMR11413.1 hypothetical protein PNEG_00436 [Pneumocystis murina B123]